MDDRTLLLILDEDPERGIALLKNQYADALWLAAAQRLDSPDDVQDCVQDTLTDFYLQRKLFDPSRGGLRAYLTTIANHKAIRRYWENRRQWLVTQISQTESLDVGEWEKREYLQQGLSRLPESDRLILELKYYNGYTAREIAEKLGMKQEAVKKRQQRALKKLLYYMKE